MATFWPAIAPLLLLQISAAPPDPPAPPRTQPALEHAVNRLEVFQALHPPVEGLDAEERRRYTELHCSADRRWCASMKRDAPDGPWRLQLCEIPFHDNPHAITGCRRRDHVPARQDRGDPEFGIWPFLVREAGGAVMVGLLSRRRMGFSGGGASVTHLSLLRAEPDADTLVEMLDVPVDGSSLVRACFEEADIRRRREACQDEYAFRGALSLLPPDGADGGGRPRFRLETRASTYPGEVRRWEDSAERPPLRQRDLVWWSDPACSYRRTFAFDAAAGRYVPDAPLPACESWLDFDWLPSVGAVQGG